MQQLDLALGIGGIGVILLRPLQPVKKWYAGVCLGIDFDNSEEVSQRCQFLDHIRCNRFFLGKLKPIRQLTEEQDDGSAPLDL